MKRVSVIVLALLAILLMGCPVRSIFPLFGEKDLVFNPALVGTWVLEDDTLYISGVKNQYEVVTPVGNDGWKPTYHTYDVLLGKLGKSWFLDSYQYIRGDAQDHLIQSHQFHQMWLRGDTLQIAEFDGDWLRKMIDSTHLAVTHVRRDNEIILTASTQELQALLVRFADDPHAFEKRTYTRLK